MTADTAVVEERGPVDTGLLDARGNKLFRLPEDRSVGFVVGTK